IGSLVTGISAVIILVWFLAPIVLQLMVNPIADFVAFMILQYTMFNHTIFYLSFFYITEPLTFLTFVGSFTNWLNPLNSLFNGISSFAKNSLSFLRNAGLTLLSGLAWNTLLKGGLLGLAGFLLLGSASLDLQGLITLFGLNTLIPNLMLWAVAILWVGLLVIVGVLGVVANLGINVPTYLTFELAVPAATMLAITVALIGMVGMLSIDISTILTAVPGIVTKLGLGSLIALVSDPIFTVLTQAGFAVIGFASIVALIAGGFMLAEDWLPSTFNIPTFLFYLIMTSPIWTVGNWDGLVPIIGWIPAIIADIGYMLIGAWGTGLLTVLNFTTWLTTSLPLVFSTVVGISLLLSLGLGGLILAPIGLIGGAVVSLVNA
ncbi:hypothetical protein, partial [Lentilactobacillus sunkii]|uniref:hypothetical protein n=1 Tax=Lentilactobacillus sunkii TaxID=481719 RepID=UPI00138F7326